MEKPHYVIRSSSDGFWYEFDSISDDRTIKKAVAYYPYSEEIYQLVFGTLINDSIDTLDNSNNQDMTKVLSTVIQTVIYFLEVYPDNSVIFTGSTPARTRLYRATISKLLENLGETYLVQGILPNFDIEIFNSSTSYYAYLISKKS
jgi:hypothetical protein